MSTPEDYRRSHLGKGADYDADLARAPFDAHLGHWEREHLLRLLQRHFPTAGRRALDFACGTGRITQLLEQQGLDAVGVDLSASMLAVARERCPRSRLIEADLTTRPLDLGRFDLVTAFRFFGNAQDELRDAALTALVPLMSPGGWLWLDNHRNPGALYARLDRLTGGSSQGMDLDLGKLRQLLARHGLQVARIISIGAWMWRSKLMHAPHAQADRLERWLNPRAAAALAPAFIVLARHA